MSNVSLTPRLYLHIPIHGALKVPDDEGNEQWLVFFSKDEYFTVSDALYGMFNQFVVDEINPKHLSPEVPEPIKPLTNAEIRQRLLANYLGGVAQPDGKSAIITPQTPVTSTNTVSMGTPASEVLARPARTDLKALGIEEVAPEGGVEDGVFRTNNNAGRDGLNFVDAELKQLVDLCYNDQESDYVRGQAFMKLVNCPVPVLARARKFMDPDVSPDGLPYRICGVRAAALSLGENYQSLPNDLSAIIMDTDTAMMVSVRDGETRVQSLNLDQSGFATPATPPAVINEANVKNESARLPTRQMQSQLALEAAAQARNQKRV